MSAHFDEVQLALHCSVYPEQPRMRWLGAWGRDETLLAAFDLWDLSGENIVEHLAEIEEFELAMATYPGRVRALARREHHFASWCGGDRTLACGRVCLAALFWPQIAPYNKQVIYCRTGGLTMHTIILAIVIALAGLVMIASGALQLSMLEAAEGEMLQMSDYLSEIGTLASGLGMLGLAEVLRLLLRITA